MSEENTLNLKNDRLAKAKAFIKKVYSQFQSNPMNPKQCIMTWGQGDDMEFVIFELATSIFKADTVEINWIQAYPQGTGVGTRAIKLLQDLAKQDGISLSLYPWDKGRISQAKLSKFYKNRGFKPIMKGRKDLIWHPELEEAESYTKASKEIRTTLRSAGYKLLGSGADATVWAKRTGSVIKIIMPDDQQGAGLAGDTFIKFYEFCKQHQNYENLPKFSDDEVKIFNVDGKDYIMVSMERLNPIPSGSFTEAMVWILSELATRKITWKTVINTIKNPNTWKNYGDDLNHEEIKYNLLNLTSKEMLEYEILFKLAK